MKFLFFAQCAEWMGCREMEIPLENPQPLLEIFKQSPKLKPVMPHLKHLKVSVNHDWGDFTREVCNGDEVALMPPFSGG